MSTATIATNPVSLHALLQSCESGKIQLPDFQRSWVWDEDRKVYDSIVNKTPLGYRTNRIIGGVAPSKYLQKLEAGRKTAAGAVEDPPIEKGVLDGYLASHCIPVDALRADNFPAFMAARHQALLKLVAMATGNAAAKPGPAEDEGEELPDEIARGSQPTNPIE